MAKRHERPGGRVFGHTWPLGFLLLFAACGGEDVTPPGPSDSGSSTLHCDVGPAAVRWNTPDGRLQIDASAGSFAEGERLLVRESSDAPAPLSSAHATLALFELTTQSGTPPRHPIALTLRDERLRAAQSPAIAAFWHPELEAWITLPESMQDAGAGTLRCVTPHFTLFGWFLQKSGYERRQFGDFELIWDADVLDVPKNVTDTAQLKGKLLYDSSNDFAQYLAQGDDPQRYSGLPALIRDAAVYLQYALRQYREAGFKVPKGPIPVVVETTLTSENARVKSLGVLHLGEYNNGSAQLKIAIAHELFHSVQNEYLWSLGGMSFLGWWCEATAEYAGSTVWHAGRPMRRPAPKYFSEALTSTQHEHEYHSAHFIDHVVGAGTTAARLKSLQKLWTGTLAQHGITDVTDVLFPMTLYLKSAGKGGVGERFREHVRDLFFAPDSPIRGTVKGADPLHPPAEMMEAWLLLRTKEKSVRPPAMPLKGGHRAKAWGIKVETEAGNAPREIEIELGGPLTGYQAATLHVLRGDRRSDVATTPTGTFGPNSRTLRASLRAEDAAYVVVVNDGSQSLEMSLEVRALEGPGVWQLLTAAEAGDDPHLPRVRMLGRRGALVGAPGDPGVAWIVPTEDIEVNARGSALRYVGAAAAALAEVTTEFAWTERIYPPSGAQDTQFRLVLRRQWLPSSWPRQLRPGTTVNLRERIEATLHPADLANHARAVPRVIALLRTRVGSETLGGQDPLHLDLTRPGAKRAPIERDVAWQVPAGRPGDRLYVSLQASDSAPAQLGHGSGSYMDEFQRAGVILVYELRSR